MHLEKLILHPATKSQLEAFLRNPTHAVILLGPPGSGKRTLALSLAAKLLNTTPEKLGVHAYFQHHAPINNAIAIQTIRSLHDFLRLKTTGQRTIRRVILIEDAQALTPDAQNAFLKTLEEPPKDTVIIMTADNRHSLLPTIYSRLQLIEVQAPAKSSLIGEFTSSGINEPDVTRAYYLSNGRVGLMTALLNADDHPLALSITEAKEILQAPLETKLFAVERFAKDKEALSGLLFALERICHAALKQAASKEKQSDVTKWHSKLQLVLQAKERLAYNPQAKLLLTDLMLNI